MLEYLLLDRFLVPRRWLLAVMWGTLATLTHIPVPQAVQGLGISDKLVHVVGYFPLGLLLPVSRCSAARSWIFPFVILAVYGIADELLQIPVGRTASVLDWVADLCGAGLGVAVCRLLSRRVTKAPDSTIP